MAENLSISVVIVSRNEGDRLRETVENIHDTLPSGSEILVVDDGSTDGSADFLARKRRTGVRCRRTGGLGVARARNFGAARTSGDVLIFADGHIAVDPGWWRALVDLVADPRVAAAAPAISDMADPGKAGYGLSLPKPDLNATWLNGGGSAPVAAPVLPGCCLAMRRGIFEKTGGFDRALAARGGVDNELCLRLWLLGYELMIAPEVNVRHVFRVEAPYPVSWSDVLHNRLRLAFVHLKPRRIGEVVLELAAYEDFGEALARVLASAPHLRKSALAPQKKRTDDWYFEKFGLQW